MAIEALSSLIDFTSVMSTNCFDYSKGPAVISANWLELNVSVTKQIQGLCQAQFAERIYLAWLVSTTRGFESPRSPCKCRALAANDVNGCFQSM